MKKRGFTFIEILVTVTIIAVLIAIGVASYASVNRRARDSKRKSDLEQIRSALEQYRADNGSYPVEGGDWVVSTSGSSWLDALVPTYMDNVPVDPKNSGGGPNGSDFGYVYAYYAGTFGDSCLTTAGREYILVAQLESAGDTKTTQFGSCQYPSSGSTLYAVGEQ